MNNKELVNAGHELAKAIGADTPIIEIAKMVTRLATALDVQQARANALVAENVGLKAIVDFVTDLDNEPQYHEAGMGCGLEDRGITDRYEAMRHGWDNAMERIYGEVIPCADEIAFPATSAFLAEVRAQGVEMAAQSEQFSTWVQQGLRSFAIGVRQGDEQ
ncbi:hypothetical protein NK529_002955 [Citrobacter amalonaticus]